MNPERLMADRALTILPPPGVHLKLMPTEYESDADLRDTLPPSPETEPPPALSIMPSDTLKQLPGFDENQFLHVALAAAADAAHEIRESRKDSDIGKLLDRQTERILKETSADYNSLRSCIRGLQESVDALVTRVGNTEHALDEGTKRFEAIEDEMQAMRSQMARLEQLRPHLDRLEEMLRVMKLKEGNNVTAEAAAPSGKQPAVTEDPIG